jgi:hypothetical protein
VRQYNSLSWMRYPLAQRTSRWVSILSSGIATSWRYSEIGYRQFVLEPDGPVTATISIPGFRVGLVGLPGVPRSVFRVRGGSPSPGGVLSAGVRLSSSSRMDNLMRSCTNTLKGGCSRLDPSRVRASIASLSRLRI